jgi:multiple sugar transport system substrate-binding protein
MVMLPFVLAVNKKILADHGLDIPSTWEQLKALGPILKQSGIHAFSMPGGAKGDSSYRFFALLCKAGGRVLNEDWTAAAFDGPAGVGALSLLVDMQKQGFFPPAAAAYLFDENLALWCTDKAAISLEGPWWQNTIEQQYDYDLAKLALAPVPGPDQPLEPHPPRTLLDVTMVSIPGYSKVKEEAWIALKSIFLDDPSMCTIDPRLSGLPTQRAAYEGEIESDFIDLDVLVSEAQVGLGWEGHPRIAQMQIILAVAVNSALAGKVSPQEALDNAAEEVNEILSDY